jgi:ABC-type proline/glycine betaine transport system permease subunit
VVESLREGSVSTWYETLWEYLSTHLLTVFFPLLIAVAAGLFFGLRWLWRFLLKYTR